MPLNRLLESYLSWDFGRKSDVWLSEGVPTVLQEPYLNSTLGFAQSSLNFEKVAF